MQCTTFKWHLHILHWSHVTEFYLKVVRQHMIHLKGHKLVVTWLSCNAAKSVPCGIPGYLRTEDAIQKSARFLSLQMQINVRYCFENVKWCQIVQPWQRIAHYEWFLAQCCYWSQTQKENQWVWLPPSQRRKWVTVANSSWFQVMRMSRGGLWESEFVHNVKSGTSGSLLCVFCDCPDGVCPDRCLLSLCLWMSVSCCLLPLNVCVKSLIQK